MTRSVVKLYPCILLSACDKKTTLAKKEHLASRPSRVGSLSSLMLRVLGPVAAQIGICVLSANSKFSHEGNNSDEAGNHGPTLIQSGFLILSAVNLDLCIFPRVCEKTRRSRSGNTRPHGRPEWVLNPIVVCPWRRGRADCASLRIHFEWALPQAIEITA